MVTQRRVTDSHTTVIVRWSHNCEHHMVTQRRASGGHTMRALDGHTTVNNLAVHVLCDDGPFKSLTVK